MLLPVAAAALIAPDNRILVAQRMQGQFDGLWEFPGGKIEDGETPEAALVRELAEELGVTVDVTALTPLAFASHDIGDRHLVLLLFAIRCWGGEPHGLLGQPARWVTAAELATLAMPPADAPLVKALADFIERDAK